MSPATYDDNTMGVVNFHYPEEELSPELRARVDAESRDLATHELKAFVQRLTILLLKSPDAKLVMVALCYLVGMDLTAFIRTEENSITSIAHSLGVSRQSFQQTCKRLAHNLGMEYRYTNRAHKCQSSYGTRNYRRTKVSN